MGGKNGKDAVLSSRHDLSQLDPDQYDTLKLDRSKSVDEGRTLRAKTKAKRTRDLKIAGDGATAHLDDDHSDEGQTQTQTLAPPRKINHERTGSFADNDDDINLKQKNAVLETIVTTRGSLPNAMSILSGDIDLHQYRRPSSRKNTPQRTSFKRSESMPPTPISRLGRQQQPPQVVQKSMQPPPFPGALQTHPSEPSTEQPANTDSGQQTRESGTYSGSQRKASDTPRRRRKLSAPESGHQRTPSNESDINNRTSNPVIAGIMSDRGNLPNAMSVLAGDVDLQKYRSYSRRNTPKRPERREAQHSRTKSLPPQTATEGNLQRKKSEDAKKKRKNKHRHENLKRVHTEPPNSNRRNSLAGGLPIPQKKPAGRANLQNRRNSLAGGLPIPGNVSPPAPRIDMKKGATRRNSLAGGLPIPGNLSPRAQEPPHNRRNSLVGGLPIPVIVNPPSRPPGGGLRICITPTASDAPTSPSSQSQSNLSPRRSASFDFGPRKVSVTSSTATRQFRHHGTGSPSASKPSPRKLPLPHLAQRRKSLPANTLDSRGVPVRKFPPVQVPKKLATSPRAHNPSRRARGITRAKTSPAREDNTDTEAYDILDRVL